MSAAEQYDIPAPPPLSSEPAPRPDLTESFFRQVFQGCEGQIASSTIAGGRVHTVFAPDPASAAKQVADLSRLPGHGAYFRPTTLRETPGTGRRGTAADTFEIACLWADVDARTPIHAAARLQHPTWEEIAHVRTEMRLAPSIVLHTVGGEQWFWLFERPIRLDDPTRLQQVESEANTWNRALSATFAEIGRHLDNVSDLARIMRPEGGLRRKSDGVGVVHRIGGDGERYKYADLIGWAHEECGRLAPYLAAERPSRPAYVANGSFTPLDILRTIPTDEILAACGQTGWTFEGSNGKYEFWRRPDASTKNCSIKRDLSNGVFLVNSSVVAEDLSSRLGEQIPPNGGVTPASWLEGFAGWSNAELTRAIGSAERGQLRPSSLLEAFAVQVAMHGASIPERVASREADRASWQELKDAERAASAPSATPLARAPMIRVPQSVPVPTVVAPPRVAPVVVEPTPYFDPLEWDDFDDLRPIMLSDADLPTPPLDVLPDWMQRRIREFSTANQSVDMCFHYAFGIAAAALTGRLKFDNGAFDGWCNLYLLMSAEPGMTKSGVFSTFVRAVRVTLVDELKKEWAAETAEAKVQTQMARATADTARKALLKSMELGPSGMPGDCAYTAEDVARLERIAVEAEEELRKNPEPDLFRDDASPESLAQKMEQVGRQVFAVDEPTVINTMVGNHYGKGKGGVNTTIYLKGYDGQRMGRTRANKAEGRGDDFDCDVHISIVAATQPDVLQTLLAREDLDGNGLIPRFALCHAIKLTGFRDTDLEDTRVYQSEYDTHLMAFARPWIRKTAEQCETVTFGPEAGALARRYRQRLEIDMRPGGPLAWDQAFGSKVANGAIWRVGAILHVLNGHGTSEPVGLETMRGAVRIINYWIEHTKFLRLNGPTNASPVAMSATSLLQWFRRRIRDKDDNIIRTPEGDWLITETHLKRERFKRGKSAELMVPTLERLEAAGWIQPVKSHYWDPRTSANKGSGACIMLHPKIDQMRSPIGADDERPSFHQVVGHADWREENQSGHPSSVLGKWLDEQRDEIRSGPKPVQVAPVDPSDVWNRLFDADPELAEPPVLLEPDPEPEPAPVQESFASFFGDDE